MTTKKGNIQADIDWENRVLCSDGNCIGIIGVKGKCRVCGKPSEGEIPESLAETLEYEDHDRNEEVSEWEDSEVTEKGEEDHSSDTEWAERRLCVDESCIGVIGRDGRCKECGIPYRD